MTIRTGPLTERQRQILEDTIEGLTQKEIARKRGVSLTVVGQDGMYTVRKFGARKVTGAVAIYSRHQAYHAAADKLESGRLEHPMLPEEVHVNHVLTVLAAELRKTADRLLPQ